MIPPSKDFKPYW